MNTAAAHLHAKYLEQLASILAKNARTAEDIKRNLSKCDPRIQAAVAGIVIGRLPPVVAKNE
jgi:hypothetical protein